MQFGAFGHFMNQGTAHRETATPILLNTTICNSLSKKFFFFLGIVTWGSTLYIHYIVFSSSETLRKDVWKARTKTCFSLLMLFHLQRITSYNCCPWVCMTMFDPWSVKTTCVPHRSSEDWQAALRIGSSRARIICTLGGWTWQPVLTSHPAFFFVLLPVMYTWKLNPAARNNISYSAILLTSSKLSAYTSGNHKFS